MGDFPTGPGAGPRGRHSKNSHGRRLTVAITPALVALIGMGVPGDRAEDPRPATAGAVIALWGPTKDGVEDFQQFVASPGDSDAVAAATYRVVGPSFERLWNHYADRCGIRDRYEPKRLLVAGGKGASGTYAVCDRVSLDATAARLLSVFLLRTDHYTVTVTIQPDPAGKGVLGSIAAEVR